VVARPRLGVFIPGAGLTFWDLCLGHY